MIKNLIVILLILGLVSFDVISDNKSLNASLTTEQWQSGINSIEVARQAIKNSNIAANVAIPLMDSLATFESRLLPQLQKQLNDTTGKK